MRCTDARLLMSEALDGRLIDSQAQTVNVHMQTCAACRERWQVMQHLSRLFDATEAAAPPPDFTQRVMQRLQRQRAARTQPARTATPPMLAWAAVAVTALLLLAVAGVNAMAPGSYAISGGSLNFLSLTMQISDSAIQAATLVEGATATAFVVLRALPLPVLLFSLVWLIGGTVGLAYTVASLVAGYQPVGTATESTRGT